MRINIILYLSLLAKDLFIKTPICRNKRQNDFFTKKIAIVTGITIAIINGYYFLLSEYIIIHIS